MCVVCVYLCVGFFGDLLTLVCQNFSMVDMVLLLHGQSQPLSRIQPQLAQFFSEHFLQGREPTEANIAVSPTFHQQYITTISVSTFLHSYCSFFSSFSQPKAAAGNLIGELDEYITESFVSESEQFWMLLYMDY